MRREKSSELSKLLFGEDLSEKIKEQIESSKIIRHVVKAEDKNKGKPVDVSRRNPFSQRRSQKTFLQEKEPESDNRQQVNADPIYNQTLKQIFPRTQKLFGQMD